MNFFVLKSYNFKIFASNLEAYSRTNLLSSYSRQTFERENSAQIYEGHKNFSKFLTDWNWDQKTRLRRKYYKNENQTEI